MKPGELQKIIERGKKKTTRKNPGQTLPLQWPRTWEYGTIISTHEEEIMWAGQSCLVIT